MKILVAFYSSSGTTRRAGQVIAEQLGADVEDIQEVKVRHLDVTKPLGLGKLARIMAAGGEANLGLRVPILPSVHNAADYDLVVLGTPIWGGRLPGPLRSWIADHRDQLKSVAFFATCGGTNPSPRAFDQMQQACGKNPRAVATFQADRVLSENPSELVKEFVRQLR